MVLRRPTSVVTDEGHTLDFTKVSPKAVAALRALARYLARTRGDGPPRHQARVLTGPIEAVLRDKAMSPFQKGCAKALFCGVAWTAKELHREGLVDSPSCIKCGQDDSYLPLAVAV